MIISRARSLYLRLLFVSSLLFGAGAHGQTPDLPPATQPPGGDSASGPTNTAAAASSAAPLTSEVTVGQLGTSEGGAVGLLDESNGGLGADMWSGSTRAELVDELSRVPIVSSDPVVRDLSRRLLLTRSVPPAGVAPHAVVTLRIQRLLQGGLIGEAGALASAADVPNDSEFEQVRAQALLYAQSSEVCGDKTKGRLASSDLFWLELRAYCYAASNDVSAADLTREIIETQGTSDGGFLTLLDDLENSSRAPPGQFLHPTPVDVFILRLLGFPVTPSVATQLGTAADLIAARDPRNSPIERLSAAQQIISTGALDSKELTAIADAQSFTSKQEASALKEARLLPFLMAQSLVRRATVLATLPETRMTLVRSVDPGFSDAGLFHMYAELQAPGLAATPIVGDIDERATAGVLIMGGYPQTAVHWIETVNNASAAKAALALDLAYPGPEQNALAIKAMTWLTTHDSQHNGGWTGATALATGIEETLGLDWTPPTPSGTDSSPLPAASLPAPPSKVFPPSTDGVELSPSIKHSIERLVPDPTRRGEALLLLLNALGSKGPARFAPGADTYFVSTLKRLNLDDAARMFGVECLLLGPPQHVGSPGPIPGQTPTTGHP